MKLPVYHVCPCTSYNNYNLMAAFRNIYGLELKRVILFSGRMEVDRPWENNS